MPNVTDDLDTRLKAERDRQVATLRAIADALNGLPVEDLTDALPTVISPMDEIVRRLRMIRVAVAAPDL